MKYKSPKAWKISKFSDVAKVVTGSTPLTSHPEYYGDFIPFIGPSELGYSVPITTSTKNLSELGSKKARILPKDSVLVCCIGATIGKVGFAGTELVTNQQMNSLVFDESKVFPRYAFYYCQTIEKLIRHQGSSTTLPILPKGRFQELEIPLPPLEEQKRIAAILDNADRIRRKRQEAIRLTEELGRSIFLDMFGDPVTNPKGWEVVKLENLLDFMTSGSRGWAKYYTEKGKIFLRIQNVKNGQLILEDVAFVDPPNNAEGMRTRVKEGDVLVSITADLGRTAVIPKNMEEAYINQHLVILRLKQDRLSPTYLSSFISSEGGQRQFSKLDREGVKSGLNFSDLKGLSIVFPPMKEQRKYEKIYTIQLNQLSNQKRALEESENLFNSLLQRAFRGEL